MKKQKENSHEGITWSEMGKQNVQAEKVYFCHAELWGCHTVWGLVSPLLVSCRSLRMYLEATHVRVEILECVVYLFVSFPFLILSPRHLHEVLRFLQLPKMKGKQLVHLRTPCSGKNYFLAKGHAFKFNILHLPYWRENDSCFIYIRQYILT